MQKYVKEGSITSDFVSEAASDALKRLIYPSLEREVRNELTEKATAQAVSMFAVNLKPLLLQPPVRDKVIMGLDPAYRTGCKIAVVDRTERYLIPRWFIRRPRKEDRGGKKGNLNG